jgi:hypothetical protein
MYIIMYLFYFIRYVCKPGIYAVLVDVDIRSWVATQ